MDRNEHIRRALRRKGSTTRLTLLLHGLLLLLTLALALVGLGTGLAAIVPVGGALFFAYGVLAWLALSFLLARALAAALRPWPAERTALLLEARYPDLDGELISTLQLGAGREYLTGTLGCSGEMIEALEQRTDGRLPAIVGRPLADRRRLRRDAAVLAAAALASLALALFPGSGWRAVLSGLLNPLAARPFAQPGIEVSPGDVRLAEGSPLEVRARVRGGLGGVLYLEVKPAGSAAPPETYAMEPRSPGEHAWSVPRVVEAISYRVVHPRAASPWYTATVAALPRAGDLAITLTPPAYTGLPPTSQEGSGHLRCLKGTIVRWRARANKPLAEASLVMSGGQSHRLAITGDTAIEGEFIVTQGGRYRVVLKDREGFSAPRPDEYDVTLTPDEFPTVELIAPAEDLEVDPDTLVEIEYSARDDFGLGGGSLVYRLESGTEGRVSLPDAGGRRAFGSRYDWDIGGLELEPGRTVTFQVEVLDNDSVSGPKTGVSAARAIRVKDTRARHRDLAELEKELVNDLTELLGDELELSGELDKTARMESEPEGDFSEALREQTAGTRTANEKFSRAMDKMDDLLRKMSRDALTEPSSLYQKVLARKMLGQVQEGEEAGAAQLDELSRMEDMPRPEKTAELSQMAKAKEKQIAKMEQALNLLQESDRYQKMEEAVRAQEDAVGLERDLLDKLEKMTGGLDAKTARELMETLQEIARKLEELANQLGSLQNELPDEFVNDDAVKDLPFNEVMQDLKDLADAIARGDTKAAREKAASLLQKMAKMLDQLKEASRKVQDLNRRSREDFQQKRQGEIEKLVAAQRELLRQGEEMDALLESRLAEERRREAAALSALATREAAAAKERLEALGRMAPLEGVTDRVVTAFLPELAVRLDELAAAGARGAGEQIHKALGEARLVAEKTAARLGELERRKEGGVLKTAGGARELSAKLGEALAAAQATASQARAVTSGEGERLRGLSGEQGALGQRAAQLGERLEKLAAAQPLISPELVADVRDASTFMESAAGKLGQLLPGEAVPDQREALYRLLKAQASAQEAAQQMAKMSGLQSGGSSPGGEMEMLFGLMPGGQSPDRNQRDGGRQGLSVRNFRIPGRQEYEVPRLFREELMESMKGGYPPPFEKAIRQYYRSITE